MVVVAIHDAAKPRLTMIGNTHGIRKYQPKAKLEAWKPATLLAVVPPQLEMEKAFYR
jgi:hypothetical protein